MADFGASAALIVAITAIYTLAMRSTARTGCVSRRPAPVPPRLGLDARSRVPAADPRRTQDGPATRDGRADAGLRPDTCKAIICSAWGPNSDWLRNIRARPALRVEIGRQSFTPEQRFLTEAETFAVAVEHRRRHPWRLRLETLTFG